VPLGGKGSCERCERVQNRKGDQSKEGEMDTHWRLTFAALGLLIAIPGPATGQAACTGMPGNDSRFCDTGFKWHRADFVNELDFKLTSDANAAIAALAPWTETDIGGPHNNEDAPTITYRPHVPPSVRFRGSTVSNQGAQWVMWQGKGFRALLGLTETEHHVFTRPLDLAYYVTVGWTPGPAGKSTALFGIMTPGTPLNSDGTLDESVGDGDPYAQTWGFYVDTSGNLRAVVLDSTVKLIDIDTGIDIVADHDYQLGITAHISGWGYSGGDIPCVETGPQGPPATESWIRWYVDGELAIPEEPAFGDGVCIQVPHNLVPGVAHVRIASPNTPPNISRMGYGFSYFE
jgi:hypothetical protein